MNDLKTIRIFLSTIFLVASLAWLFIGPDVNPLAIISVKSQIIPSTLAATIGATAFWLVATFVFGRLYCSTVCPVGSLQDLAIWSRRYLARLSRKNRSLTRPYQFVPPSRGRWTFLTLYAASLLLGVFSVAWILEPWRLLQSVAGLERHAAVADTWAHSGIFISLADGALIGCIISALILLVVILMALIRGRWFCNKICPIGTALGAITQYSLYHIEINPDKCINCMKCEDICPAQCVKVLSRHVDDSRCIRCFNCLKVCPNDAIRYQINHNRRRTPLMQRRKQFNT
ncbi:MAG: 4Fe-4S binding protein [Muribaculaceae bacterium]|nr:4Fe-4S binding protein [Muribaculaceae bacterium]